LSIPVAGSTVVPRHTLCSSSLIRYQGSFRCTPMLRRLRISGHKGIALATSTSCSKHYIRFVPGPACWGSAPLYVPPLSYKRGGTQRYKAETHLDSQTHKFIQALKLNTSHGGVGYYAPAARTTLNPCVFLCSSHFHLTGKTLRLLLILGFRAGAFRHPAVDFLSDSHDNYKIYSLRPKLKFVLHFYWIHRIINVCVL
jgi:hypothetical protein